MTVVRKLLWGLGYVGAFALSFLGGAAIALASMSGSGVAGIGPVDWDASVGTVETDLRYGEAELNTFDLYLPADRTGATKMVVFLHAGGFTGGDKADDETFAKYFTSRGYVVATLNYSLRSDSNSVSLPEMTAEVAVGVDAAFRAATERDYPVDGLVLGGGSAGGNLAMTYAYRDAATAPAPVRAVIAMVGPASFEPSDWFGYEAGYASDEAAEEGAAFVSVMTGADVSPAMMRSGEYRQYLAPVSPAMLVTPDSPPSLLAYGELDKVTPYAASAAMDGVLEAHGVPHDVLVFPNSGHGLNRDPELSAELGRMIDHYLDTYAPLG